MTTRPCDFPDCDKPHRAKGLCAAHYRQQYLGEQLRPLRGSKHYRTCRVPGCDSDRVKAYRLCGTHYSQARRRGDFEDATPCAVDGCLNLRSATSEPLCPTHTNHQKRGLPLAPLAAYDPHAHRPTGCGFEGCDRPHKCKGLCATHYEQHRRGSELRPIGATRRRVVKGCTKSGCDERHHSKGLCRRHYQQQWAASQPRKLAARRRSTPKPKRAPKPKPAPKPVQVEPPRTDWTVLLHQPKPSPVSKRSNSPLETSLLALQPLTVTPAMERRAALVARSLGWDDDLLTMLGINQEAAA